VSEETDFLQSIKRSLRTIAISTVLLYCCLAVVGIAGWQIRVNDLKHVNAIATQNQTALCALRTDLEQRVETAKQFLLDHPNGTPGIPDVTIRQSITNQESTIDALSNLNCGG
jgi:predicted negative regulator of RcsB-dependent stress response